MEIPPTCAGGITVRSMAVERCDRGNSILAERRGSVRSSGGKKGRIKIGGMIPMDSALLHPPRILA